MAFGITDQGFNPKLFDDIKGELDEDAQTAFGSDVGLSEYEEIGMFVQLMSKALSETWEGLEDVYYSAYIDQAAGVTLDRVVALGGLSRRSAQKSTVSISVSGVDGTTFDTGEVTIQTAQAIQFENIVTGTIPSGTVLDVTFRSIVGGQDTVVPANTITEFVTPFPGLTGVNNLLASSGGAEIESDPNLIARYKERGTAGGSSVPAILAALLNLDNVSQAAVVENASNVTDAESRPPHSIECVVGGTATDTEIGEVIFNSKPAGIETLGSESYMAIDENGDPHTVKWNVPVEKLVNVTVTVITNSEWVSTNVTVIKTKVVEAIGGVDTIDGVTTEYEGLAVGADVKTWEIIANFDDITGMDAVSVLLAFYPAAPSISDLLTIASDEFARCDTANISVVV